MCGCHTPKQCFITMTCYSELYAIILWCVISKKLNVGKKITGLEMMMLNCMKKTSMFLQTYRTDV